MWVQPEAAPTFFSGAGNLKTKRRYASSFFNQYDSYQETPQLVEIKLNSRFIMATNKTCAEALDSTDCRVAIAKV
jgi:hypothetical protein